jgi:hypothetical protein
MLWRLPSAHGPAGVRLCRTPIPEFAQWRRELAEREEQWRAECEKPLFKWQREAREHEEAVERETDRQRVKERCMSQANQVEIRSEDWDSWNAWADGRIAAALKRHQRFLMDVVGEALGEIRAGLRVEFRKELEAATAKLGIELRELIAGLQIELARLETELARLETELARLLTSLETETVGLHLRGAYRSDQDYDRLDVVTLDGSSYIARRESPGPCPGEGWRILASAGGTGPQGIRGPKGERGLPGPAGESGPPGKPDAPLADWRVDPDSYSAFPVMADGKEGPALELRALFQQFFNQVSRN